MTSLLPGMPEYMVLAVEHHKTLIEEAKRHREVQDARRSSILERPLRWRRLRRTVGELLIYMGQRLKTGTTYTGATNTVWG